MNSRRLIFVGLLCLLIAFSGSAKLWAQDSEVKIIINVNDRGLVTGISLEPSSITIGGASESGKADGGKVKFVIDVRPAGKTAFVDIQVTFDKSPFHGGVKAAFATLVRANGTSSTFPIPPAQANVTEGTYPFKVEVTDKNAPVHDPVDVFTAQGQIRVVDMTPPGCGPRPVPMDCGGKTCIQIPVQDQGSGLAKIEVTRADNADVTGTSGFTLGTKEKVVVTATRQNESVGAQVQLVVTDMAGNAKSCDPVLTQVLRANGKPLHETYLGIQQEEHIVTIWNGNPGLNQLEILVNGKRYHLQNLKDGQEQTLDVSAAMVPGDKNIFVLKATGKPGGRAVLMIWDGQN